MLCVLQNVEKKSKMLRAQVETSVDWFRNKKKSKIVVKLGGGEVLASTHIESVNNID